MRQLQKKLEEHLTQDIPLPPGTSVFSVTDAIRKIKMAYKDRFAGMLGKTAMSRIVDTHQLPPSTASTSGKRKRKKRDKQETKTLVTPGRPMHISPKTWNLLSLVTQQYIIEHSSHLSLIQSGDENGSGASSGSDSSDETSSDDSDPDTVSDKSSDSDISIPDTVFDQGVISSSTPKTDAGTSKGGF